MGVLFVLAVGLVAGVISGIVGTGSSIMLVPVLAAVYGPKAAVPIMAVAALMANVSRVLAWWRSVDRRAFVAYGAPGALAAAAGARTLLVLPPRAVDLAIGAFLVAMIPGRRWLASHLVRLRLIHLALGGAVIGFLTGIVVSTGPISVPLFVAYGLAKGAFIGTEAAGSLAVYASKILTFRGAGALPTEELTKGLVVGASLMAGSFLAKPFVLRLSPETFRFAMDGLMLLAGLSMVWSGLSPG
ncbi:sulfite exporter TauE/SafE family protein [Methylobacterium oxalidis]|uniref:sulfite exporter TauE/SafE family protein n=1 Tax=Methylobacterium oxalidis TaxID=944322 RepID=UPI0033153E14